MDSIVAIKMVAISLAIVILTERDGMAVITTSTKISEGDYIEMGVRLDSKLSVVGEPMDSDLDVETMEVIGENDEEVGNYQLDNENHRDRDLNLEERTS